MRQAYCSRGFTLIELMIVVAIVGILVAVALPSYRDYTAKAQAASGLATIGALKTAAEDVYTGGAVPASISQLGIHASASTLGTVTGVFGSTGIATLTFTFDGQVNPLIKDESHTFARTENGEWSCSSTVDSRYKPKSCN